MFKRSIVPVLLLTLALGGCTTFWTGGVEPRRHGSSSSLVDFLYPNGEQPAGLPDRLPYLELPIRVGIAFVPGTMRDELPASEQQVLLERVAEAFRDRPFVSAIEAIPSSYLRTTKGITGMQQVARLFNVDIMALVSYDQLAISDERDSAIFYWTVVGALVVKGNINEVQTMIDTAVFDVDTAQLLFRAPGMHRDSENATFMDAGRDMRQMQSGSYSVATDDMVLNLNHSLEKFREDVKRGERVEVAWKEGHGGGGSIGWTSLVLLLLSVCRGFQHRSCGAPDQYSSRV